jgi:hypothetical protein
MNPVHAKEDTAKMSHGVQTAVVHLRRFAPRLSEEQIFKVTHLLNPVSFPLEEPYAALLRKNTNILLVWRGCISNCYPPLHHLR